MGPSLGRFMQTDPIGYGDGMNWYNYVGGDPVNFVDPMGLSCTGSRIVDNNTGNCAGGGYVANGFTFIEGSGGSGGYGAITGGGGGSKPAKGTIIESKTFREGAIFLYKRGDYKKPIWLCRIKVPGSRGFITRSTGTGDEHQAFEFADDLYHQLLVKSLSGELVVGKRMGPVIESYLKRLEPLKGRQPIHYKMLLMKRGNLTRNFSLNTDQFAGFTSPHPQFRLVRPLNPRNFSCGRRSCRNRISGTT